MSKKYYFVYLMTNNHNTVLYCGISNNLIRRVQEHKLKLNSKNFTKQYNVTKLVWYEVHESIHAAIEREKQIKGGSRKKKEGLINTENSDWKDLFDELV
jgi:putative endonuclease